MRTSLYRDVEAFLFLGSKVFVKHTYIYNYEINNLENRCYTLRPKSNGTSSQEKLASTIILQDTFLNELAVDFLSTYRFIEIPTFYNNLLDEVLKKYELFKKKPEFITILGFLNYAVNLHKLDKTREEIEKSLLSDYQNEKKEWSNLLDFIKDYLNQKKRPGIDKITVQTENSSLILKNFFVIKDFIEGLCSGYNITRDNYDERRNEILYDLNSIRIDKISDFVIRKTTAELVAVLMSNGCKKNKSLRFVGFLFRLSGVKTYNDEDIEVYKTLEDNLNDVNIKNLRLQINRIPPLHS